MPMTDEQAGGGALPTRSQNGTLVEARPLIAFATWDARCTSGIPESASLKPIASFMARLCGRPLSRSRVGWRMRMEGALDASSLKEALTEALSAG